MRIIRSALKDNHPNVNQKIARILINYCLYENDRDKRELLEWLRGSEIDTERAKQLGLPGATWVSLDETSNDAAVQQAREEFALRSIQTIGVLSTYYRPLILAFDQLEGLRNEQVITKNWGKVVREIFTMTPNMLILTCIFPDLWSEWFEPNLERGVVDRVGQTKIDLDTFSPTWGRKLLEMHLKEWYQKFRLPNSIYPFTPEEIESIGKQIAQNVKTNTPRGFLQEINQRLEDWIYQDENENDTDHTDTEEPNREAVNKFLDIKWKETSETGRIWEKTIPVENDYFGRVHTIIKAFTARQKTVTPQKSAVFEKRVMPLNTVFYDSQQRCSVCFGLLNSMTNSFASRMKNLISLIQRGDSFSRVALFRHSGIGGLGTASEKHIETFKESAGIFHEIEKEEAVFLNTLYAMLIAAEEHDLYHQREITKDDVINYLFDCKDLSQYPFFQILFRLLPSVGDERNKSQQTQSEPVLPPITPSKNKEERNRTYSQGQTPPSPPTNEEEQSEPPKPLPLADIVVGNKDLSSGQMGIIGKLKEDGKWVGLSFLKPMCALVTGYMGSGKSYALGVIIENALLNIPNVTKNDRSVSVIVFNYRKNSESRFEYSSYTSPNRNEKEVSRLENDYRAKPQGIATLKVLGYAPEISHRMKEYGNAEVLPIQFLPDELSAEHWTILMKPPTATSEYMNIARDIIQKLHYDGKLTFANLVRAVEDDAGLSKSQRQNLSNRLRFVKKWITDKRDYQWSDVFSRNTLVTFDLRMQTMTSEDAQRLCLILTDIARKTQNGVNKIIVFDEAHEYFDSKQLVDELDNAISQIRHDGLSFIFATQYPERIPRNIVKYLTTRFIFKIPDKKAIDFLCSMSSNLSGLPPVQVHNLDKESGECFIQTEDDCSDDLLKKPQRLKVRPRCSQHGGATKES